jgi:hypothetical protein
LFLTFARSFLKKKIFLFFLKDLLCRRGQGLKKMLPLQARSRGPLLPPLLLVIFVFLTLACDRKPPVIFCLKNKNAPFAPPPLALRAKVAFLFFLISFARASFLLLFLLILIKIASKRQNKRQEKKNKKCFLCKQIGSKGRPASCYFFFYPCLLRGTSKGSKNKNNKEEGGAKVKKTKMLPLREAQRGKQRRGKG